jgi:hypothetical protein
VPEELKQCDHMGDAANRLYQWGYDFWNSPYTFMANASARTMKNIMYIYSDVSNIIRALTEGQWEQAGLEFADICELSLGQVPDVNQMLI